MVAASAAAGAVVLAALAELLHARRCRRWAAVAFGPAGRPRAWARSAPALRVAAMGALAWGLTTLLLLPPRVHEAKVAGEGETRHLVLVLDVSPSMKLDDAGPDGKQPRAARVKSLVESMFKRVVLEQLRVTVIAVYTGAAPVVVDTRDVEVVRNILSDLPLYQAFPSGKTDLFAGLAEAAKIAAPWRLRSTSLVVLSDGDTVPSTGMPKMPPSVSEVLVVGVGDARTGKFIDGHQSRQDVSTLRQMALRLGGTYHDGNQKHVPSDLVRRLARVELAGTFERWTAREIALLACGAGGAIIGLLPLALAAAGSAWRPGAAPARRAPVSGGAACARS